MIDPLADVRRFAIDADAPGNNPFLNLTARAMTGIGKRLVQLGRINEDLAIAPSALTNLAGRVRRTSRSAAGADCLRCSSAGLACRRPERTTLASCRRAGRGLARALG